MDRIRNGEIKSTMAVSQEKPPGKDTKSSPEKITRISDWSPLGKRKRSGPKSLWKNGIKEAMER